MSYGILFGAVGGGGWLINKISQSCDNYLNRFAQADSIIPLESQGVQAWDRYAGMNNNPVRYNDPSGHCVEAISAVICFGVAAGLFTMAMDYAAHGNWGDGAPNMGFGCMDRRCGGLADYFRDRGAVVWAVASVANTVTAGATTPGLFTGSTIASGQTAPLVSGVAETGLLSGVVNTAQTAAQNALLGEPNEPDKLLWQFGVGLVTGAFTGMLDEIGLQDIHNTQRNNALEYIYAQKAASEAPQTIISKYTTKIIPLPEFPASTPYSVGMGWMSRGVGLISKMVSAR